MNHLPECNEYTSLHSNAPCICAALHAHGMRIMSKTIEHYQVNDYALGYESCQREAVREISKQPWTHDNWMSYDERVQALNIIRQLSAVHEESE